MPALEIAIQKVETAHQNLISGNPADFDISGIAALMRGAAVAALAELLRTAQPSAAQIARMSRVNLEGLLYLERVRLARQTVREELASAGQEGHVLYGYRSGSN